MNSILNMIFLLNAITVQDSNIVNKFIVPQVPPVTEEIIVEEQPKQEAPFIIRQNSRAVHTVQEGETLYALEKRYQIPQERIIEENEISDPDVLKVNEELTIPSIDETDQTLIEENKEANTSNLINDLKGEEPLAIAIAPVQLGTIRLQEEIKEMRQRFPEEDPPTVIEKSAQEPFVKPEWFEESKSDEEPVQLATAPQTNYIERNELLNISMEENVRPELPPLANPDEYLPGSEVFNGFIWPAKGVLTSGFGQRWGRMHRGIDIAAPVGTPIFAAAGGEVVSAGWNSGGYGNLVKIKHSDESITLYAHNSRILVRNGQQVKQGQQIAAMGSTGFSTGPHLHFEVHKPGLGAKNPIAYLPDIEN